MKKIYESANAEVVALSSNDIIKTSSIFNTTPDNEVDAGGKW